MEFLKYLNSEFNWSSLLYKRQEKSLYVSKNESIYCITSAASTYLFRGAGIYSTNSSIVVIVDRPWL